MNRLGHVYQGTGHMQPSMPVQPTMQMTPGTQQPHHMQVQPAMHMAPIMQHQVQPNMQMQPMQMTPGMHQQQVQPTMQVQPGMQQAWQMQPMPFVHGHHQAHEGMSDTTLELPGSASDYSDDYSYSEISSRAKTRTKNHRKRKSRGRQHRKDRKGKKARKGKKKDKDGKGSSSDDHDTAAFPGTTYRFLGGKELPGSTTERAKQSYPKSHKVAILKEMCPIITVTRPVGMVECSIIHIGLC